MYIIGFIQYSSIVYFFISRLNSSAWASSEVILGLVWIPYDSCLDVIDKFFIDSCSAYIENNNCEGGIQRKKRKIVCMCEKDPEDVSSDGKEAKSRSKKN